jgi:hypothetical protein
MGELVTAHIHENTVRMIPITFPDYVCPSDEFITNYGQSVDISALGAHGIDLPRVQETIRWLSQLPDIRITQEISNESVDSLAHSILTRSFGNLAAKKSSFSEGKVKSQKTQVAQVAISADHSNMESMATAMVICKFVAKLTYHDSSQIPILLTEDQAFDPQFKKCIFVLSNGAFVNPQFVRNLKGAAETGVQYIPIIAEDGFRFPTEDLLQELRERLPPILKQNNCDVPVELMLIIIQDLFKEIAIVFSPQDYSATEQLLLLKAKDIATRLLSNGLQYVSLTAAEEALGCKSVRLSMPTLHKTSSEQQMPAAEKTAADSTKFNEASRDSDEIMDGIMKLVETASDSRMAEIMDAAASWNKTGDLDRGVLLKKHEEVQTPRS